MITNKHDIAAVKIRDKGEMLLPDVGFMQIRDSESGKTQIINTSNKEIRQQHSQWWKNNERQLNDIFKKTGTDVIPLYTDEDYIPKLKDFFKKRS